MSDSDASIEAAQLALLALRTSVGALTLQSEVRWVLLPDATPLVSDRLAAVLAAGQKPMRCHASRVGSEIHVYCTLESSAEDLHLHEMFATSFDDQLRGLSSVSAPDPILIVDSPGESVRARFSAIRLFVEQYRIDALVLGLQPPNASEHNNCGTVILRAAGNQ
jgi:hypothetical protein